MSDSPELQKDKAIKSLIELRNRILNLQINNKGQEVSKNQIYEYDEIVALLDIYFISYAIHSNSLRSRLSNLAPRPKSSKRLSDVYDEIISIVNSCIEEIRANFEFSINPEINSLKVTVSRPYVYELKENIIKNDVQRDRLIELDTKLSETINSKLKAENDKIPLEAEIQSFKEKIIFFEDKLAKAVEERTTLESRVETLSIENTTLTTELRHFKEQAQRTEVARNSTNFHKQAETNKRTALIWGISTVFSIIIFLIAIYFILSKSGELFNVATTIYKDSKGIEPTLIHQLILIEIGKKIGAKLLMVSIIIYFITFLTKNYNAQMHNYIINSHKANALRSTVDLIGTAKQDDGNDKIILQATQAIFTPQKSGYQGAESEPSSPNLITNVVDAVSGGKKN